MSSRNHEITNYDIVDSVESTVNNLKEKIDYINENIAFSFATSYQIKDILKRCLEFIEKGKAHYLENQNESTSHKLELEYLFQFSQLFNQLILINCIKSREILHETGNRIITCFTKRRKEDTLP